MADVYKFKVKLVGLEDYIWRDIDLTSVSSVAKLGYAILISFETTSSHLFNIRHKGKLYEILYDDYLVMEPTFNPIKTKLSALQLVIGDKLTMKYDYGAGWEFSIELIEIKEMKKNTGRAYPLITDGKGKGIMEGSTPSELLEAVKYTEETGEIPNSVDVFSGKKKEWDYRNLIIEFSNARLDGWLIGIRNNYERGVCDYSKIHIKNFH